MRAAEPAPDLAHETLEQQILRLFAEPVPRRTSDLALADMLTATLCYRRSPTAPGVDPYLVDTILDRLRRQERLPHPDTLTRLASAEFAQAHAALGRA